MPIERLRPDPIPPVRPLPEVRAQAGPFDEVLAVCRLFRWLLSGLVTDLAFFRHRLGAR